jgi:hypothetical protein
MDLPNVFFKKKIFNFLTFYPIYFDYLLCIHQFDHWLFNLIFMSFYQFEILCLMIFSIKIFIGNLIYQASIIRPNFFIKLNHDKLILIFKYFYFFLLRFFLFLDSFAIVCLSRFDFNFSDIWPDCKLKLPSKHIIF